METALTIVFGHDCCETLFIRALGLPHLGSRRNLDLGFFKGLVHVCLSVASN